jgi:hypothetical protein
MSRTTFRPGLIVGTSAGFVLIVRPQTDHDELGGSNDPQCPKSGGDDGWLLRTFWLHGEFKRKIKMQTVLPSADITASGLEMLSEAQRQYSNESNEEQQGYDQDGLHIIAVGSHCSVAAM